MISHTILFEPREITKRNYILYDFRKIFSVLITYQNVRIRSTVVVLTSVQITELLPVIATCCYSTPFCRSCDQNKAMAEAVQKVRKKKVSDIALRNQELFRDSIIFYFSFKYFLFASKISGIDVGSF